MEEIPRICPPVWSPEEQDANCRFEDTMKMRLCQYTALRSSQGLLNDEATKAIDDEEDRPVSLLWSVSQSFEGA